MPMRASLKSRQLKLPLDPPNKTRVLVLPDCNRALSCFGNVISAIAAVMSIGSVPDVSTSTIAPVSRPCPVPGSSHAGWIG